MKDKTGWNKYRRGPAKKTSTENSLVTIDALSSSGDGIGRVDGRAVFVPRTMPGDVVRIKLVHHKKNYAHGQLLQLVTPSEQRVSPACDYFGQCGGCQWQHIPYEHQIAAKKLHLQHVLTHIGKLENPNIQPVIEAPDAYHYRNRIQGEVRDGEFFFKHKGSNQGISVRQCVIADKAINRYLENADLQKGLQGRVEIASIGESVSVLQINNQQSTELGFRQVNTSISQLLNQQLKAIVNTSQCSTVIDLYCGRGSWSVALATDNPERQCIGVDSSADNIRLAREAAEKAGVTNAEFIEARVEASLNSLPLDNSLCIVDPPRAGLHADARSALCHRQPEQIIYISCHPATLARDLLEMTTSQYELQSVIPLDMFPQTPHLECLARLTRKRPG